MAQIEAALFQVFVMMYQIIGDLGWVIIIFTLITRLVLVPLTLPTQRLQKEMRKLQPELKKLKNKHGKDRQALQQAQLELYKKYNINPLAGCLPQLVQIGLFIILYRVLIHFLNTPEINGIQIDPNFWWLNLTQVDPTRVLPVVAGVTQLILALMVAPGAETPDIVPNQASQKAVQKANEKEEDMAEMAATMQQQMIFIMPVITGFVALSFPAGLVLYWIATTVFSIAQQWMVSGPGGLVTYSQRAWDKIISLTESRRK